MKDIVGSDRDPLQVVVGFVLDEKLDTQTRLGAASICLRYLYPTLSQTNVQATHLTVKADPVDLLAQIDERISRIRVAAQIEAPEKVE